MKPFIRVLFICLFLCNLLTIFTFAETERKITIAMVPKGLHNPVFLDTWKAAQARAQELGVELIWTAPQKVDMAEQVAVIESLIQKKVDAIGIGVSDPSALVDVINKAVEAGIVVSTWDSDAPESRRMFYLGTDNYAGGKTCGEYMKRLLPQGGNVAVLTGFIGAFNLEERIRGFKDATQDAGIEVIDVLPGDDDFNKSVEVVNTYTLANKGRFDAWFFAGGWPLFVPVDTLKPIKDLSGRVVSFDAFPPMLTFVKEGIVSTLVGQNFAKMGSGSVEMLYQAVTAGKTFAEFNDSGLEIVEQINIDEVIAQKGTSW